MSEAREWRGAQLKLFVVSGDDATTDDSNGEPQEVKEVSHKVHQDHEGRK